MLAIKNWLQKIQLPVRETTKPYLILHHADKILYDFSSLLHGFNSHNLTPYVYLNNDNAYEDLITKCESYYLCREESEVIKENLDQIANDIDDTEIVVELGPGSKSSFNKKTLVLIDKLARLKKYISVDISEDSAKAAAVLARKYNNALSSSYIVEFFESFNINVKGSVKKTFILFGSTLGNFSEDEAARLIENVSRNMNKGDKFLITLDTNQNATSLKAAYNNQFIRKLVFNSLFVIDRKLNCNIDFNSISLNYAWNKEESEVEYFFVSSVTQNIRYNGISLEITKDKKYPFIRSRKFDSFSVQRYFTKYDLDLLKTYKDDNNRMVVFLFVKK